MDESLKARLIGAAVLVALAVLLIPELLSGRKAAELQPADPAAARGIRTFTIELAGEAGPATVQSPPAVAAPQPAPAAVAPRPASAAPATESTPERGPEPAPPEPPATAQQRPAPVAVAKAPAAAPVVAPSASAPAPAAVAPGGWAVQVGAFGSAASAQKLVKDLQGAGYRAYLSPVNRSGKTLHRVRVGPETDRDAADRLAGRLKGRGLPAAVVAND